MYTKIIRLDPLNFSIDQLQEAVDLIKRDEIVAFPTETVYGLGGSAFSETAVRKIFKAKGRPSDNPMIVHISDLEMLSSIVKTIPEKIRKLCERFWPGPLTILFDKSDKIPDIVTAGLSTVAVRMPSQPLALALIKTLGIPIAAPSANLSSRPSPTQAKHVFDDLQGKIPLIIDGGSCDVGVESTVIDVHKGFSVILRPGGVNLEKLREYLPEIEMYREKNIDKLDEYSPQSPGLKYKHYSPKAEIVLIEGSIKFFEEKIVSLYSEYRLQRIIIGIIHTHKNIQISSEILDDPNCKIIYLGSLDSKTDSDNSINADKIAEGLFSTLRAVDNQKIDLVIVEGISDKKIGLAVMNRLRRAASKIIKE
ncbi:L-threonylcarbamoyladenylate synthase [Promethearchaeum syntrophicum]|uniref:Threonylcarbamoyl-AMP synthase n=1 Tax=Promethearchaeum syntrophicum TaxID=2594042 RepID=A0A5B9D730_9ARCH|nr:L-threonylcarbamoyladenylate synthase [Candidatus Prometheoarchaeum syntrophicum]QEE14968.1 Threonylcarbamoyl-AMP synthase [Candidatus Prometheoarchaeum syntrophicum]